jgi:SAM-dependent methyltransferase
MARRPTAAGLSLDANVADRMATPNRTERLVALGYGLSYDAVVRGFRPYDLLVGEVAALVGRSAAAAGTRLRVLDVSCGIGTVAARLARAGHAVVGVDAVEHLVAVARTKAAGLDGVDLAFHHLDIADGRVPGAGTYDVLVSMHTLYWHPRPEAMLEACRRALRPGGHAVFLTYTRPAHVGRTFGDVRRADGFLPALRSLRWLVPTALFESLRRCDHRYLNEPEFHAVLRAAGFDVLESRRTFLAGISLLVWARAPAESPGP